MIKKLFFALFIIIICASAFTAPAPRIAKAQQEIQGALTGVSAPCGSDPSQVGCWQFSEGSGGTTADGSGNHNTGSLVGAAWTTDRFGNTNQALQFNGSSQYVTVPTTDTLDIHGAITLAVWVKPSATTTQHLIQKGISTGGTATPGGYELSLAQTSAGQTAFFRLNQGTSANTYRIDTKTQYTAGNWIHVAGTYDPNPSNPIMHIYINGVQDDDAVTPGPATILAMDTDLNLGRDPGGGQYFNGTMDDARIYNRALSASEIRSLFNDTAPAGFNCTPLISAAGTASTGEKPMSKVWNYDGKWWSVFPDSSGSWIWRLDGTTWTQSYRLSLATGTKADVKPVGSVVHVLLYDGSGADLASAQYNAGSGEYEAWSSRGTLTSVSLPGSETATIDIDSTGRMWLNSQHDVTGSRVIIVFYSDSPYSTWSVSNGIAKDTLVGDDISAITSLPNNTVGVLWANEVTHKFGFSYHVDGADPLTWSAEENPSTQYGYDTGVAGFADDHINVAVASDGTLYAAIKTSYDTGGMPRIALMVRRLSGTAGAGVWDQMIYGVSEAGTRPIVLLDESAGVVTVIYTSVEGGGDILYNQSAIQPISFGATQTMRSGSNNDVSSTKQNINGELVAIYSSGTTVNGSRCTAIQPGQVNAPTNLSAAVAPGSQVDLSWTDNSNNETGFAVEVAPGTACTAWSPLGTTGSNVATFRHWNTTVNTPYCYRVRATGSSGNSDWSNTATATTPASYSALSLGRNSAYVRMTTVDQSAIQLKQFTIETWFRREGTGISYSTGSSGIAQGIPLVGKGSSVEDGSAQDINYILVIDDATNVIAADFEECNPATQQPDCISTEGSAGLNHPIRGTTPILNNTWHHAAVTFDGTTLRLYLDGGLENTVVVGHLPRWDNASPLGLGTSMINNGTPQGFFDGSLDEVRIWSYARSQAEIITTINSQITAPTTGLVARWSLDEGSGTSVNGSAGTTVNGTIYPNPGATGWNWTAAAPFDVGFSPEPPVLLSPADGATGVPSNAANLQVTVDDIDSESLTVSYFGREYCAAANFTLVALPDTQYYAQGYPTVFTSQTNWIVNNRTARNIAYVTALGDIVNDASVTGEWANADAAYDILDVSPPIPYGLSVGNHDSYPMGTPANTANFNAYFGEARFTDKPFYGGHYGSDNDNSAYVFTAGGMDFIAIQLEYNLSPDSAVLAWADALLKADTSRRGFVVFHDLAASSSALTAAGQTVYDSLKDNPNLFMMLGGHSITEYEFPLTENEHTVYIVQSDYQSRPNGGNGWLRLMEFQPTDNQIQVSTYSPYLDQSETDADSQFTIPYSMNGAGCNPFEPIQTLNDVPHGSSPVFNWDGRTEGINYEWYVTVSDGTHTVTSPIWSFTTAGPTAVGLTNLTASSNPLAILLSWQTAQENDLLGFNVYRSESVGGARALLNPQLVPALSPGQLQGNLYQYVDDSAQAGTTYYYWIEWVGSAGAQEYGPVSARIGPYFLFLPLGMK